MSETLGFIGLGNMGEPIAANLMQAGYSVRVYNRTASKTAQLVQKGASLASTSADVAAPGGIVFTMLADDALSKVFAFRQARLSNALARAVSTFRSARFRPPPRAASRNTTKNIRWNMWPRRFLDVPQQSSPEPRGSASSGSVAAKTRVKPILEATSQAIFDFGDDPGGANVVKLCGNFLIASAMESLAEIFALARKNGVDPKSVADFFGKTLFACPIYQAYGKLINARQFEPAGFRLVLGLKDINLALQTAASSAVPMPVASLLRDRWLTGVAKGRGDMDWSVIALGVAEDAGLD